MEMLIPVRTVEIGREISLAFFLISQPLNTTNKGLNFSVFKNRSDDAYLKIDSATVIKIHPSRKTFGLVEAFRKLQSLGVVSASSIDLLSAFNSNNEVTHTIGELIPNELMAAYKLLPEMFSRGYRALPLNAEVTPAPEISQIEYVLNKIKTGNEILVYSTALVSVKNEELKKDVEDITKLMVNLAQVQGLLQAGALGTARIFIKMLMPAYPEYEESFTFAVDKITDFETQTGVPL